MHTGLVVAQILISIIMVVSIMLQPSKADGLSGFITGGTTETFYSKNKSRTKEALLAKITVVSAVLFAVITLSLNLIK
jgi:preprotein translocase subunit SecG